MNRSCEDRSFLMCERAACGVVCERSNDLRGLDYLQQVQELVARLRFVEGHGPFGGCQ